MAVGRHVYGLGVVALAVIALAWGDFLLGQPVPKGFPARTALAYLAGAYLLVAGAAIEWRRTMTWGAAALTAYYSLVVVLLMNGRSLIVHHAQYGAYDGLAEEVAITSGALVVYASSASIDAARATRLKRAAQIAFGACALVFGGAHFVYMDMTAPLVPRWLPPTPEFWGYATGVFHVAAGVAIMTGVQARLAAVLMTIMLATFAVLVHAPTLVADRSSLMNWTEAALNLVILGAAWVMADSLTPAGREAPDP